MKLLYLSCHSILEYDELKLFEEMGIDYFSLGSYIVPTAPTDSIRPALKHTPDPWLTANAPQKDQLTQEFVDHFDTIVVMHVPEWIIRNWPVIKHKRVIWRSIGQSTTKVEQLLAPFKHEGLEVVRYSPREQFIQGNIGYDAMIRFYKDENEFNHWIGAENQTITFTQNMKHRAEFCNYETWLKVTKDIKATVYGPNNEDMGERNGGLLTYDGMKQKMRDGRSYLYTGTQPASYTLNFIEALMTGIPVVAIGPKYANSLKIAGPTYEVHEIITNGINGFWSDDVKELNKYLKALSNDMALARVIGRAGRETAIKHFGKETVKQYWQKFLKI